MSEGKERPFQETEEVEYPLMPSRRRSILPWVFRYIRPQPHPERAYIRKHELAKEAFDSKNKKFFEILFTHPDHHNVSDLGKGFETYTHGIKGLDELFLTLDPKHHGCID